MEKTDLPTSEGQPTPLPPPQQIAHSRSTARWNRVITAIAVAVVAVLAWQSYDTREQMREMRDSLARRLAESDKGALEARAMSQQTQTGLENMQNKIGALEASVQQAQGQYAALDAMYAEFSRARDERAVTEVEQAINIAAQQLQLAGNIPAALAALQNADSRLALLDQARFLGLRKLIARDIERLKALPLSDASSVALQLETIMGRIDSLPLGFEHLPPLAVNKVKTSAPKQTKRGSKEVAASVPPAVTASAPASNKVADIAQDIWGEFRQLIRIERMDRPDAALLSPSQAGFLRENLRMRLLSARLALMQRDGKVFSEDIHQAREWLQRYFDTQAPKVTDTLTELSRIEQARLTMSLPDLEETQNALRNLKLSARR